MRRCRLAWLTWLLSMALLAAGLAACKEGAQTKGAAVGEPCEKTIDCQDGLNCYTGGISGAGTCTKACDPENYDFDNNLSEDCADFSDFNSSESRCAVDKEDRQAGICRPVCENDAQCAERRDGMRCYGYNHPLLRQNHPQFTGLYCTFRGRAGAACEGQDDCALDLTCYVDQAPACDEAHPCPGYKQCNPAGQCVRVPEGFCTKACQILPDDVTAAVWAEVIEGWSNLSLENQQQIVSENKGESVDCPVGSRCGPSGLCRPECEDLTASARNEFCYENRYDRECEADDDCPADGLCGTDHNCQPVCFAGGNCAALDYECRDSEGYFLCLPILE